MSPNLTHLPLPGDDLLRLPRPSRELRGDGFGLCTEILGSESCEMVPEEARVVEKEQRQGTRRRLDRQQRREFPPPIRWLQLPGKREMRAERKEGRLIVREVRVNRETGIFRVERQDGRLRLFLSESEGFPEMGEEEKALEEEEKEAVRAEDGERWEWPRLERWRRFAYAVVSGGREAVQWCSSNFTAIA